MTDATTSPLDAAWVDGLTGSFSDARANRVARNAVTSANVHAAARDVTRMRTYHDTFSVSRPHTGEVTNQRQSGRCWMFSALNVLRAATMDLLDVDSFEFSEAYLMFYDKLEKFNAGLGNVIRTADQPESSREVCYVLDEAMGDGGYYPFAMGLVEKWGLVPKDAMPEGACTKSSAQMNQQLERLFHKCAHELRGLVASGAKGDAVQARRQEMVADCHRMLCVCLGEPPLTLDLEVKVGKKCRATHGTIVRQEGAAAADGPTGDDHDGEKDEKDARQLLVDRSITPQQFRERYVPLDPRDFVDLVCMPGKTRPFGHLYHQTLTDSVEGGIPTNALNVEQDVLERAAVVSLRAGVPVSMSCDVGQDFPRRIEDFPGVLATDTMDYEGLFGIDLSMGRADMLDARETSLTHAMTFQGVELDDAGGPVAWRVENSWGKDACKDGYLVMSAEWFRLYGGEVLVRREFVDEATLALWDTLEPEDVAPWDGICACRPRLD